jgi:hypothetical protein
VFVLMLLLFSGVLNAGCRVMDPELQDAYSGPCADGLAEGAGAASGTAEYRGGFKGGRKHGRGVKTWANGDRYEGGFAEDRREGSGVYVFGRGPWEGERYEGAFANDQRHGHGVYRWTSGDVYAGPWKNDRAAGPPTQMMQARAQAGREARSALARAGAKVCRELAIGIAGREWIQGTVTATQGADDGMKIAVRIDRPGKQPHVIGGIAIDAGTTFWDSPHAWSACW